MKTDDTLDVRNAAAAFPAAKPLLRRAASSEQHEPASGVGVPTPTRPGASGRSSKRIVMRARIRTHETVRQGGGRQPRLRGRRRRSRKARAPESETRWHHLDLSGVEDQNARDSSLGRLRLPARWMRLAMLRYRSWCCCGWDRPSPGGGWPLRRRLRLEASTVREVRIAGWGAAAWLEQARLASLDGGAPTGRPAAPLRALSARKVLTLMLPKSSPFGSVNAQQFRTAAAKPVIMLTQDARRGTVKSCRCPSIAQAKHPMLRPEVDDDIGVSIG